MKPKIFSKWMILLFLAMSLIPTITTTAIDLAGRNFIITDSPEEEVAPALAYNAERGEYLAVWQNDRGGNCDDIYAQRIAANGQLLGDWFSISAGCPTDRRFPQVAYNTRHDQYLVVFVCVDTTGHQSLCARRVSGTGQLYDQTDLIISSNTTFSPDVTYAYTSDNYLIAWIDISLSPLTYTVKTAAIDHLGSLVVEKTVTASSQPKSSLAIAYNRHANRHLLVWEQENGGHDIMGIQVLGDGEDSWGPIKTYADEVDDCRMPAVAALPTSDSTIKFFVAFQRPLGMKYGIYGRLINEDGTLHSETIAASSLSKDHFMPAVAASESRQEYFVVWYTTDASGASRVEGRRYNPVGTQQSGTIAISEKDGEYPDVTGGSVGDFLVVWEAIPLVLSDRDVVGQIFGDRVYLPLVIH